MRVVNYVIEEANIDWLSWCWKKKNQQDRAVSAPDSKFPIIAYHQNALPSGSRRRWPHLVGHLRVWNLLLECTRNRVGAANGKRTPAQIKKKEKVHSGCDKGMKKVTLRSIPLVEPTGKFEYYVLHSKRKAPVAETTTQTQTPPLGEDQVSIPFTESSSPNRNNQSEASSASHVPPTRN